MVPLIVLALGIALVSTGGAADNFGQKLGSIPILGHSNNPGPISGQKPGNNDFKFNPGHKPDNDINQWNKGTISNLDTTVIGIIRTIGITNLSPTTISGIGIINPGTITPMIRRGIRH